MQTKGVLVTLITLLLAITSFGQFVPTVYTDKLDYQPGEVVIIEGDGWRPGEQVKLEIDHSSITHGNTILYATADVNGHIWNDQFIIQPFHLGESFVLTATGMSSGYTATTKFTDANSFTAVITPTSINSGASGSFTIRVTNISNGGGSAAIKSIEIAIPSAFTGVATTGISTSANASSTFSFETGAGYTNGYNGSVIRCKAPTGDGLQGNVNPNPPYVDITFTATSPVVASATNYTLTSKASELNTYVFTPPNNVPIQKTGSVDQHPILTVNACVAPSVVSQPAAQTVTYGNNATFTFQTSNATYQWQESTNGGGAWNNISNGSVYSGVTTNSLSLIKPPVSYNGYQYRCVASFCSPVKTTTSNAVTLTVNKASLTVTADNKNKTYGDANPDFTVSYAGFVSGEGTSALTTQPTANSTATANTGVGNYPIIPSGGVAANYSFTYVNGTLAIGARGVTVTADAQSKIYGEADPELTYKITTGELVGTDDFSGALTRVTGDNVGVYAIQQGNLALSGNYTLAYVGANLTINKRAITVTADAQSKIYGEADPELTYKITTGELVGTDDFSGALTRVTGDNVGVYAIQQGNLALSGNYTLAYVGANLTINKRAITVTADAQSKIYGEADPELTYKITTGELVGTDGFSGALTRVTGDNVGVYAIQQGNLALSGNYTLAYVGANLTINKRAITVTADAQSKIYGEADPELTYKITTGELVGTDDFSGALTRVTGDNVGVYAIQQGNLALSGNYTLAYVGANLTINKRAITVTADAQSKIYGEADPELTYKITTGELVGTDDFSGALTRVTGDNVGVYAIQQGNLALSGNYTLAYVGANLTINKRAITVTADAQSKIYGEADPELTYKITTGELVGTDDFSGALTRVTGDNVGVYAIQQGNLALSGNYTLAYVGANLTINKRAITVTADAQSKIYGEADPELTYKITTGELVGTDDFSGALTRVTGDNVGVYAIQQGNLALSGNYTLAYVGANLTINKRAITVTADAQSKIYGEADPELTYKITTGELVGTDGFSGALTRVTGDNVGVYAIQQGNLALSGNYTLAYVGANLTINKRAITVTADAQSKIYGEADPELTYKITTGELVGTDDFSGALTRVTGDNVGVYAIQQGNLALSGNYTLAYVGANLTINKRAITVTADAQSKIYGEADPELTYKITTGELVGTDDFSGALTRVTGDNVGVYAIQQGNLALSGNYTLAYVGANLTINKRAITVTADAQSKIYGEADPELTYKITTGELVGTDGFSGALTRVTGDNVGVYAIQQGNLALSGNYTLAYVGANLTINKRAITVTADAQSKIYGEADPELTYKITTGELVGTDGFSGALTRVTGDNVGVYAIQQGNLSLSGNYTLAYVGANLTINKRAITVTADAQSKIYGEADPELTYKITTGELVGTDDFSGALTRVTGDNVGVYAIQQGNLALSGNYTLAYVGANLTINKRAITVTADAQSKIYGEADPELTYKITTGELVGTDDFSGALTRVTGDNVGVYAIQQGNLALSGNYTLAYVGANLTINKRAITVTADAQSKIYGEADPELTYKITTGELVGTDDFSGALTRVTGDNVGVYAIQQGNLSLSGNYTLAYVGANLTINKRAITVTADAQSKIYGEADPELTYKITTGELVGTDDFSGALTRVTGDNVGVYAIQQGNLALSGNYTLAYVGANLTINKRAITVTAQAKSKIYGNTDPALTYQITTGSLAYNDAFSGALARAAGEDIGVYAIQQGSLALSSNYILTYVGANLTIGKRTLTITVNSKNKLYGAPIPTLDGIETGIVASDNITVSYSTTATNASPIGVYPITATLNDPDGRLFNYTVTNTPATLTIAVVPVTTYVSTNVASQQYSDMVTFTATINNGAPVVTGANGAAVSVTFKVGNQIMGTVPFTVSGNNLVGVLTNKQLVEGLAGQMAPGAKTVTAIFNTPNVNYGLNSSNNTGTCSLSITQENAEITYTGQTYLSLPTTSAISLTVNLSATIRDLFPSADGNRGNIKNARVTFKRDDGSILGAQSLIPVLMTDSTTGLVSTSFTYTLNQTEQQSGGANFQIYAVVDNYYNISISDMPTNIIIARPGADFVTGGGYLKNSSCAGIIAGTKDLKTNFGFNMQYTKSGSNLKGQCNIIIRSNGRIYQVKSNAVNMLAVSAPPQGSTSVPAYFNTKANYKDITDPSNPIALGGNLDLTVKMSDVSTGGQGDQVSILIMDPNTTQVVFSSNWNGVQTVLQNLGGGNVSVRSTPSNTTITSAREEKVEEIQMPVFVNPFTVKVLGNPAQGHFNVNIKGSEGKISLRVVDIQGRVVESRQNVPEGTLQLGSSYRPGYYYLEVKQGNNIKQIKLVKL